MDSGLKALEVPCLVRASDSVGDSIGLGVEVDPVESEESLSRRFMVDRIELLAREDIRQAILLRAKRSDPQSSQA